MNNFRCFPSISYIFGRFCIKIYMETSSFICRNKSTLKSYTMVVIGSYWATTLNRKEKCSVLMGGSDARRKLKKASQWANFQWGVTFKVDKLQIIRATCSKKYIELSHHSTPPLLNLSKRNYVKFTLLFTLIILFQPEIRIKLYSNLVSLC